MSVGKKRTNEEQKAKLKPSWVFSQTKVGRAALKSIQGPFLITKA